MYRVGIDLGGTKTEGVVIDAAGRILARERRPTPANAGYHAILANIVAVVADLERRTASGCRVGIGTPGALSTRTGRLKNSNTTCLNDQPIKEDLEQRLARPVRIANDANCFALSEAIDGAGANAPVVFGVILGTGVGGGVVVEGKLVEGLQHIAGEWGHNVLEADGPPCYCGKRGCVETFLSGPGFLRDYLAGGGTSASSVEEILARATGGERAAEQSLARYLDRFGRALSVVVNILDPHVIVLGGGLSNMEALYTAGRDRLAAYVFNDELRTALRRNVHGDSSGVRGAAALWPVE